MPANNAVFYNHKERTYVSHQISRAVASEISGQRSVQWISRSAPSLPSQAAEECSVAKFYDEYPQPLELDDTVPSLLPFDEAASRTYLKVGIPGIAVKLVPHKRYVNSVRYLLCTT